MKWFENIMQNFKSKSQKNDSNLFTRNKNYGVYKKVQNGKRYHCKEYLVNDIKFTIKVEENLNDSDKILSQKFREEVNNSYLSVKKISIANSNEFFNDIDFLISQLDKTGISPQYMFDAYYNLLVKHIEKFGRLVDSDIELYIDRILIIMESIVSTQSKSSEENTPEVYIRNRRTYRKHTQEIFYDYIYLTIRDHSGKSYLKKLEDVQ